MSSFSSILRESLAEGKERAREIIAAVDETVRSEFGGQQRETKASRYLDAQHQKLHAAQQQQQQQLETPTGEPPSSSFSCSSTTHPSASAARSATDQARGAAAKGTPAAPGHHRHQRTAPLIGDSAAPAALPTASSFTGRRPQLHLGDNSRTGAAGASPTAAAPRLPRPQPPARAGQNPSTAGALDVGVGRSAGGSSAAQGATAWPHGSAGIAAASAAGSGAVDYCQLAAEWGVSPLFAAVAHGDHAAVKKMLGAGSRVDVNAPVDASRVPLAALGAAVRAARLPRRPGSALELAVARRDEGMVGLLMDRNAVLRVPRQLSLEELRRKAHERQQAQQAQRAQHAAAPGGGVRRGGQLEGWDDGLGVFDPAFLDDPEVQRTLGWRDYEAQLLTHTTPAIVERILKRQGYQLTLSRESNPHELSALFESAVAAGNAYMVEAMAGKGVGVDAPTFRREQLPLCVAANTLQPDMVAKLLHMGASLRNSEVMAGELYEGQRQREEGQQQQQQQGEEWAKEAAAATAAQATARQPAGGSATTSGPRADARPAPSLTAASAAGARPSSPPRERWHPLPDACLMFLQVGAAAGWPDLSSAPVPGSEERFALAARVVEVMQAAGATAPEGMVAALHRRPPLADAPPEAQHGYAELLRILLRQREWSPQHHAAFPFAFKEHARCAVLCGSMLLQNPGATIAEEGEEGEEEGEEKEAQAKEAEAAGQKEDAGAGAAHVPSASAAAVASAAAGELGDVSTQLAAASLTSRDGAAEGEGANAAARRMLAEASDEALARIRGAVYPLSRWLQPQPQ